jgi:hypothetical protein
MLPKLLVSYAFLSHPIHYKIMYYGMGPEGFIPPRNETSLLGQVVVQVVPRPFHCVTHVVIHISSVFSVVRPFTKITDTDLAPI